MDNIQKLEAQINKLKKQGVSALMPQSSGWFSRKLIALLVVAGVVVFLGRDQVSSVILALVWSVIAYLAAQCLPDTIKEWQAGAVAKAKIDADARVRVAWLEAVTKDGVFSDDERKQMLEAMKE